METQNKTMRYIPPFCIEESEEIYFMESTKEEFENQEIMDSYEQYKQSIKEHQEAKKRHEEEKENKLPQDYIDILVLQSIEILERFAPEKLAKPVVTTKDGVDLYEGDDAWYIFNSDPFKTQITKELVEKYPLVYYFSTKEKAFECIDKEYNVFHDEFKKMQNNK
jgi:hypothetical protein